MAYSALKQSAPRATVMHERREPTRADAGVSDPSTRASSRVGSSHSASRPSAKSTPNARRAIQFDASSSQRAAHTDASTVSGSSGHGSGHHRATLFDGGSRKSVHERSLHIPHINARRSTVKPSQMVSGSTLFRVGFGDLLFGKEVNSDAAMDEEKRERLIAFWRVSARSSHMQVPVNSIPTTDGVDFFVSHAWQPPTMPEALDLEAYALQKVEALSQYCVSRASLGWSGSNPENEPWFLTDPAIWQDMEEQDPADDPKHEWRSWQCWVDKACAVIPGSAIDAVPNSIDLVQTTKAALRASKTFLAIVTWQYFSRLWCIFEWATFVIRAAPHYRQIELVIPEACIADGLWPQLIETVSCFSLKALHTGSESDHPQLWRELEQIIVSTQGFEGFIQATLLALLARYALLLCTRQCPAFCATISNPQSSSSPLQLEPLVDACHKLGLKSLAVILHSAKPRGWWNLAFRRARDKQKTDAENEKRRESKLYTAIEKESRDDPLDRLWKAFSKKLKNKKDAAENEKTTVSDSVMAAKYAIQMISKKSEMQEAVFGAAGSVAQINKRLSDHKDDDPQFGSEDNDPEEVELASQASAGCQPPEEDWLQDLPMEPTSPVSKETIVGERLSQLLPSMQRRSSKEAGDDLKHIESQPFSEVRTFSEVRSEPNVAKSLFGGLPDGLGPFWRGLKGKPLSEEERVRAAIFRNAWIEYRRVVDKWFDKHVCPALEVWRQRGIRIPSLLEETFGTSFQPVTGALQDVLCNYLTPKAREMFLAREPPPRGRPARSFDAPWDNPALNHLIPLQSDHSDKESEIKKASVFAVCSLPLRITPEPPYKLFCVRLVDTNEWQHVALPHHLGDEALTNALRHLLQDKAHTKVELEVIVPRLALKVRGFDNYRIVLGAHVSGMLRHSRRRKVTVFSKMAESTSSTITFNTTTTESSAEDAAPDPLGWDRWKCSDTRLNEDEESSESSEEAAPDNVANLNSDDSDTVFRYGRPASEPMRRNVRALRPYRTFTPRRLGGAASDAPGQIAFEKARANIGSDKFESGGAAQGSAPTSNRRWKGAGGLLPGEASLRPPKMPTVAVGSKQKAAAMTVQCIQRPRPRSVERLPQIASPNSGQERPAQEVAPASARAQSTRDLEHKDAAHKQSEAMMKTLSISTAQILGQTLAARQTWQWSVHTYGGAALSESSWIGTFREIFSRLERWIDQGLVNQWMPIDAVAEAHGRGFGGAQGQEQVPEEDDSHADGMASAMGKLAHRPQCRICGRTDLATVQLDNSMLLHIWNVPACTVCITCGNVERVSTEQTGMDRAAAIDGDVVLEVCTTVLLRPGTASRFQHIAQRVLRIEAEQVIVAAPAENSNTAPTSAKSRVAHVSLCGRSTGVSTAVVTVNRCTKFGMPKNATTFMRDHEWVYTCLRDTGLDLVYGEDRPIAIDQAIGELDDIRALPRRRDVSPLVLWVELRHILSDGFDPYEWTRASQELLGRGKFSLPAAITMRQNTEKLRIAAGVQLADQTRRDSRCSSRGGRGAKMAIIQPDIWPLALHRVFLTDGDQVKETLGAALNNAGIEVDGPEELFEKGVSLIETLHSDAVPATPKSNDKGMAAAVRAAAAWRTSAILSNSPMVMGSKGGNDKAFMPILTSPKHRASVGFHALMSADGELDFTPQLSDNKGRRKTFGNIGKRVLDPAAVMRNLAYRRNRRGGDMAAEGRAMLRARRLLRLMQVSSFLTTLHERVTANDDWRFAHMDDESTVDAFSDSDGSSLEDEEDGAKSESSSALSADQKQQTKSVEELTVQKVLGHAREFVHHMDIIRKALQVLNAIVQTCSLFLANASVTNRGNRQHRRGSVKNHRAPAVERVILEQGFVRTALRTIYRHGKRPEIGEEALKLLEHLTRGELESDIRKRACTELSTPPENVLTLIVAAGKFSTGGDTTQLRSILRLMLIIVQPESAPPVPQGREHDAATALIELFQQHESDIEFCEMSIQLLHNFTNDQPLCTAFFEEGLCTPIRQWLRKSSDGHIAALWRTAVEEETKNLPFGHSGKGAMHLREKLDKLNAVPLRVGACEKTAWRILSKLTKGGAVSTNFLEESSQTIQHGVAEMSREPRTTQWCPAMACMADLVLSHSDALAAPFIQAGGLALMLAEVPNGAVADVVPMILAVLTVEGHVPLPEKGPGETDDEDEAKQVHDAREKAMERRDSKRDFREQRRESRRLSQQSGMDRDGVKEDIRRLSQSFLEVEASRASRQSPTKKHHRRSFAAKKSEHHASGDSLTCRAKSWFTMNHAVIKCLDAIRAYPEDAKMQTPLFAILAELCRGDDESHGAALKEFEQYRGLHGGGLSEVFVSLQRHADDTHLVESNLSLLLSLLENVRNLAQISAEIDQSSEILMSALWKHMKKPSVRRRALSCARAMRKTVPHLTHNFAEAWEAELHAFETRQVERHTSGLQVSKVPNDVRRFGALVYIHRYALKNGNRPIVEAVAALRDHSRDAEIAQVGLSALVRGTSYQLAERCKELTQEGTFPAALNRILLLYPDEATVLMVLQLVTGILQAASDENLTEHEEEYASAAAMAVSQMFEVTMEWSVQTWDAVLVGVEAVGRLSGGVEILERYEVLECIEDEWDTFTDSDEEIARLITKSYKEETKKVIDLLTNC